MLRGSNQPKVVLPAARWAIGQHAGSTLYVTVCKNTILSNLKRGERRPVIRVSRRKYGKARRCHGLTFPGVRVRYKPVRPLPWGARAQVEIDVRG